MDMFNLPDDRFYNGYEDEPEVELSLDGNEQESIHIWFGYISDILDHPDLSGNGWTGFMRDYQQGERTIENLGQIVPIDLDEYIADWKQYSDRVFDLPETKECYDFILAFMEYARREGRTVTVTYW